MCVNSFLFADDLFILSVSLSDMKYLLDSCVKCMDSLGMEINTRKTACIRIGPRHNAPVANLVLNGTPLTWNQDLSYLGLVVCSAKKFTVNQQKLKQKFFRSLNGIFGKIGVKSAPQVVLSLIELCCLPALLYASECVMWNASMIKALKYLCSCIYKLFSTYDISTATYCQYYMGQLPVELRIVARKLKFLHAIKNCNSFVLHSLLFNDSEEVSMKAKYGINNCDNWKHSLWKYFEAKLV